MISRQHKKRARQKTIQQFVFAALFLVLVIFLNETNRNPLTGISHFIVVPTIKMAEGVRNEISNFINVLRSKQSLVEQNNNLKQQLLETRGSSLINTALKEENKELKHLLGRDTSQNLILATVVSKPNVSTYDTLIIDIGTKDGVHVGDEVVVLGDFLAGFISKVFTNSSQVTLLSSPGVKTNILIGENDIAGVAVGRGAGNFVSELPRDLGVSKGDIVTLSGLDTQVFGEVELIIRTEADAFQNILFKSPVNVFSIKRVQVIRSNSEI